LSRGFAGWLFSFSFAPRRCGVACVVNRLGVGVGKCRDIVSGDFGAIEDDGFQCVHQFARCAVSAVGGLFQHAL